MLGWCWLLVLVGVVWSWEKKEWDNGWGAVFILSFQINIHSFPQLSVISFSEHPDKQTPKSSPKPKPTKTMRSARRSARKSDRS
jgi:hypothetical protein